MCDMQAAGWSSPGPSRPPPAPIPPTQEAHGCRQAVIIKTPPAATTADQAGSAGLRAPSPDSRIWGRGGGWVCWQPTPLPSAGPAPALPQRPPRSGQKAAGKSSLSRRAQPGAGYIWMVKVMTHLHAVLPPICLTLVRSPGAEGGLIFRSGIPW